MILSLFIPDIYLTNWSLASACAPEYIYPRMETQYIESLYPLTFRQKDAKILGEHLKLRHSVELVGMKHVGISNFLQFFLYHERIVKTYIDPAQKHIFIAVDLNDLVEKEIFAFWVLTFKRLVDKVEHFADFNADDKKIISSLFLNSIQSRNIFLTLENLRESIEIIVKNEILPTIFFIRFDRMKDAVSEEFLANLQGLRDATGQKLAFVFTSFRSLDELAPDVFSRKSLSVFSHLMYIKTAGIDDIKVIFEVFEKRYNISPTKEVLLKILELCGGHVQYLQISLIILNATFAKGKTVDAANLFTTLVRDERVGLISEEIWDSLTEGERSIVKKVIEHVDFDGDSAALEYLEETGLVVRDDFGPKVFSTLFEFFVKRFLKSGNGETVDFTKKENLLFGLLLKNLGQICEREAIISTVWSEYEDMGVSDWTIDQLVARLRTKLQKQKSPYAVKTVRTRGYRLVEES